MISALDNKRYFIAETAKDFRAPWTESKHDVTRTMRSFHRVNLPAGTILPQTARITVLKDAAALYEQTDIGPDKRTRIGAGPRVSPVYGPGQSGLQGWFSSAYSPAVLDDAANTELLFFRSASRADISNEWTERCSSRSPVRLISFSAPEALINGA